MVHINSAISLSLAGYASLVCVLRIAFCVLYSYATVDVVQMREHAGVAREARVHIGVNTFCSMARASQRRSVFDFLEICPVPVCALFLRLPEDHDENSQEKTK